MLRQNKHTDSYGHCNYLLPATRHCCTFFKQISIDSLWITVTPVSAARSAHWHVLDIHSTVELKLFENIHYSDCLSSLFKVRLKIKKFTIALPCVSNSVFVSISLLPEGGHSLCRRKICVFNFILKMDDGRSLNGGRFQMWYTIVRHM
jgi:hypothetical protein